MAKIAKPESQDNLRVLLDRLAEEVVRKTLDDAEATIREKSDVLKTAGNYWAMSRKNAPPEEPESAWKGYHAKMNGKAPNGAENHA